MRHERCSFTFKCNELHTEPERHIYLRPTNAVYLSDIFRARLGERVRAKTDVRCVPIVHQKTPLGFCSGRIEIISMGEGKNAITNTITSLYAQ